MERTLQVCLLAGLIGLALPKAAASPVEGVWEGKIEGLRAATLQIHGRDGKMEGNVIFYIVDKTFHDAGARIIGTQKRPMTKVRWDGKVLRFSVPHKDPDDALSTDFEMTLTGSDSAELRRMGANGQQETTVRMVREP
jgi:hypothetical protein